MRPNVLLVVLDAARRDALEPYGAAPGSSPAVAQLAARGATLEGLYAAGCWTVPSHGSMFSGLFPRAAGLSRVPGGSPHDCRPAVEGLTDRWLPEVLRRAGYRTAAVSANLWLSPASGFATGFDRFELVASGRHAQIHAAGPRARLAWSLEGLRARVDDGARAAESATARLTDEIDERPFFWFVNLVECHSPYLPPRPYNDLGPLERLRAAEDARRYQNLDAIWRACAGGFDIPDESLERMRHLYRRSVRYLDDWLARLLERLDGRGVLGDTLTIVTSDHGENLGEGGLLAHTLSLDNRLIHVPFVAAGPSSERLSMRSLVELPRAIAAAVDLDGHPWTEELPDTASVAQFDPGTEGSDPRIVEALERWGLGEDAVRRLTSSQTAAVAGHLKLVRRDRDELVYDLAADPLELRPLPAREDPDRELDPLRRALEHPAVTAVRSLDRAPRPEASDDDVRDLEERMRLLGYM
jgi:arylsulfatase A-like enzyme